MTHLAWEQIWDLLDDESDGLDDYRRHVHACLVCAARLKTAQSTAIAIRQALHPAMREAHENQFVQKVMQHIEHSHPDGLYQWGLSSQRHRIHAKTQFRLSSPTWWAAVSAAAVIVAVGGVWANQSRPSVPFRQDRPLASNLGSGTASSTSGNQPQQVIHSSLMNQSTDPSTHLSVDKSVTFASTSSLTFAFGARISGPGSVGNDPAPVAGARVSLFDHGTLLVSGMTDQNGALKTQALSVSSGEMTPPFELTQHGRRTYLTAVVSKPGYRPVVQYDVNVTSGQVLLWNATVRKASRAALPEMIDSGIHPSDAAQYARLMAQVMNNVKLTARSSAHPTSTGSIQVEVVDQVGKPVSGARVGFVEVYPMAQSVTTGPNGLTRRVAVSGVPDPRAQYPGQADARLSHVVSVYALKSGYIGSLRLYQPISAQPSGFVRLVIESLNELHHRGVNHSDVPIGAPWVVPPSINATQQLVDWVNAHG